MNQKIYLFFLISFIIVLSVLYLLTTNNEVIPGLNVTFKSNNIEIFDKIITTNLIKSSCNKPVKFSFQTLRRGNNRIYEARYVFPAQTQAEHYLIRIIVTRAGSLLNPNQYQKHYQDIRKSFADRGLEYLRSQFPRIGKRAQIEFFGFGPGGSAYGITFTTGDERFDVRIILSNLMPDGVEDPECNLEVLARSIEKCYQNN